MSKKTEGEPKKKHFESKFDAQKLREMVLSGCNADQIQEALGVVSKQSLRQHVMKLCHEDQQFYHVPGLYVRNLSRPQINFKGEIRLSKKMLDFPGSTYVHGDQFEIEMDNHKIVLTRVTAENKVESETTPEEE